MATVGKSAGDIYALSTLGSVLGAVLSGFVLIPALAISQILYGTSILLVLLGALGYTLSQARIPMRELAAAGVACFLGFWPRQEAATNILLSKDSPYGQIKILDFGAKRYLLVNGTTQSVASLDTYETESQYIHGLEWAALLRPARRALVIGVGAGLLPMLLESHYGMRVDSVDVDPEIIKAARKYFRFSPQGQVSLEDGRTFLERGQERYGLIVLDAFSSETPPYHLFTREAFEAARRRLEPDGILAVNLVTLARGRGQLPWASAYKTLRQVFPQVRAFQASDPYEDLGNVLFFCSQTPLREVLAQTPRPAIREDLRLMLSRELKLEEPALSKALGLSDDRAPMEFLLAQTSLRWRAQLQKKIPDILLY
jgi:spermidine synthase